MASSGRIYHAAPSTTSPIGGTAASIGRVRDRRRRRVAERLLASRVADGRGRGHDGPLTFDHLAAWYLDDYLVRRLRTVDTARGRVANLRATFGGQPATVMTTEAIRSYQRTGLAAGAAAATVNRETSALSRMLQLAIRAGALDHRSVFPERLEEPRAAPRVLRTCGLRSGPPAPPTRVPRCPRLRLLLGLAEACDSGAALERSRRGRWRRAPVAGTVQDAGWAGAADCAAHCRGAGPPTGPATGRGSRSVSARCGHGPGPGGRRGPRRVDGPGCPGDSSMIAAGRRPGTSSAPASLNGWRCS